MLRKKEHLYYIRLDWTEPIVQKQLQIVQIECNKSLLFIYLLVFLTLHYCVYIVDCWLLFILGTKQTSIL